MKIKFDARPWLILILIVAAIGWFVWRHFKNRLDEKQI